MKKLLVTVALLIVIGIAATAGMVVSGIYNVAADEAHWGVTLRVLEAVRDASIERRARSVQVPDLEKPDLVYKGAGAYAAMCVSCHLAPGLKPTELSKGLYPAPPVLSERRVDPKAAYVAIKHGIKMSGMPAWGGPHGDEQVWSLVAFISRLPGMSPEQYQAYVRSPKANASAQMAAHGTGMMPAGSADHRRAGMEAMHASPEHKAVEQGHGEEARR